MGDFRFEPNMGEIDALLDDPAVDELLQEVGDEIADAAASRASKDSGAGAASLHAEVHRGEAPEAFPSTYSPEDDLPTAYVGWDQEHYYMLFVEEGTEDMAPRPFLRPAIDQASI